MWHLSQFLNKPFMSSLWGPPLRQARCAETKHIAPEQAELLVWGEKPTRWQVNWQCWMPQEPGRTRAFCLRETWQLAQRRWCLAWSLGWLACLGAQGAWGWQVQAECTSLGISSLPLSSGVHCQVRKGPGWGDREVSQPSTSNSQPRHERESRKGVRALEGIWELESGTCLWEHWEVLGP